MSITVEGGRERWQGDFVLEPVGLDRDGNIVHIDDLDYTSDGERDE